MIDILPGGIETSLYVNDLAMYCQFSSMTIIERVLQGCLYKLVTLVEEKGSGYQKKQGQTIFTHLFISDLLQRAPIFAI